MIQVHVFSKGHQNAVYVKVFDTELDAEKLESDIWQAKDEGRGRLSFTDKVNDGLTVKTTLELSEVFLIQMVTKPV